MFDFTSLLEFSRSHCVAICATLVPINLVVTLQTLLLTFFRRSLTYIWLSASVASLCAIVLMLHVLTWFMIGVVMLPSYVLLVLGTLCLGSNAVALAIASYRSKPTTVPTPGLS
ncbi:hypothetical protein IQ268_26545 [Oculatella sp. LEGE 06141]|uniref:hypothetical protein n=1 Tax=Oculatella sp. LEGE 06141 TaxID=1828648 RepID=UPI001880888B|nr:hypothetical protein [Oculatella sp. LEGE 06141]MBE9182130.1 hypothetical protein [Oculatella sp. LEGE 06141]